MSEKQEVFFVESNITEIYQILRYIRELSRTLEYDRSTAEAEAKTKTEATMKAAFSAITDNMKWCLA